MIRSERIALVLLGVAVSTVVVIMGVTRCSDGEMSSERPLAVDTLAVPVATDTVATVASQEDSAGHRSRPVRRRKKRKQRDVAAPVPPRDYLDERT